MLPADMHHDATELLIDGALGEGGGQILRTSLALSLCLQKPFRIVNIRRARRNPGLRPQHLAAVRAAAELGDAHVDGADIGSRELRFAPSALRHGRHAFDIGTAGSTMLVLQTLLPALIRAAGPSVLHLQGGTHNPNAPPFEFLDRAFAPLLRRMGAVVQLRLERPGFYPAGGGAVSADVQPASRLRGLHLLQRGAIKGLRARAMVAHLPDHIAQRELRVLQESLQIPPAECVAQRAEAAVGQGNAVMVFVESEMLTEVFSGFGQRGVRAETVARRVADEAAEYLAAHVPVGRYLSDQLLLPLALAGTGEFITLEPSSHARTNASVIQQFLNIDVAFEAEQRGRWRVSLRSGMQAG